MCFLSESVLEWSMFWKREKLYSVLDAAHGINMFSFWNVSAVSAFYSVIQTVAAL